MLITFKTEDAHVAFHSMTEGMLEVAQDDYVSCGNHAPSRVPLFESLITATAWEKGTDYPLAFPLSPGLGDVARDVLENIKEEEDYSPDSILLTDGTPLLGNVRGEMGAEEALQEAIAILELRCSETDTASPEGWRARCALQTLQDILAQRGCEDFEVGGRCRESGKLTDVIDVVMFG